MGDGSGGCNEAGVIVLPWEVVVCTKNASLVPSDCCVVMCFLGGKRRYPTQMVKGLYSTHSKWLRGQQVFLCLLLICEFLDRCLYPRQPKFGS